MSPNENLHFIVREFKESKEYAAMVHTARNARKPKKI
jgi:hypothetical protein